MDKTERGWGGKGDWLLFKEKKLPKFRKELSLAFMGLGLVLLFSLIFPLISYQFVEARRFSGRNIVKPIPDDNFFDQEISTLSSEELAREVSLGRMPEKIEGLNINDWFPNFEFDGPSDEKSDYYLSVPSLGIKDAHVELGGTNLDKSLVHWGSSVMPGKRGIVIIFGHSVLPQFFDPTNYMTIFSTLPTLDQGDEIIIKFDNIEYVYAVDRMWEIDPQDVSIMTQDYSDAYVYLITCVPPGTYLKKLVVRGRLVS